MNPIEWFVSLLTPLVCVVCAKESKALCGRCNGAFVQVGRIPCSASVTSLAGLWAFTEHSGYAKDMVHELKFGRCKAYAKEMAFLMSNSTPPLSKNSIISYIPTANKRVRQRGYDQARLVAFYYSRNKHTKMEPLLTRSGNVRQVGANKALRQKQMRGVFNVNNKSQIKNKTIILIDDVVTTGATLSSAAEVLIQNGAKQVVGVVFAYKA